MVSGRTTTQGGTEGLRVTFNNTAFLAAAAKFSKFVQEELEKNGEEVYDSSVRSGFWTWIGKNAKGEYYQFYSAGDGTAHFAGKIPETKVAKDVREQPGQQ